MNGTVVRLGIIERSCVSLYANKPPSPRRCLFVCDETCQFKTLSQQKDEKLMIEDNFFRSREYHRAVKKASPQQF